MVLPVKQGSRERLPRALLVVPSLIVLLLMLNLVLSRGTGLSSIPQQHPIPGLVDSTSTSTKAAGNPSAEKTERISERTSSDTPHCRHVSKPIPPLKTRYDIARLCEKEGLKTGVELGVQNGNFAKQNLLNWPSCERYYMVDLWAPLENYVDAANVPAELQDKRYQTAQRNVKQWGSKAVLIRNYTTHAVHDIKEQVSFVYVDARHDYCGVLEDIKAWWPKIKPGGLMAGHDFHTAAEVAAIAKSENWSVCGDGSINPGAVKGAVLDFFTERQLQVVVTYGEKAFHSWAVRKPELVCTGLK